MDRIGICRVLRRFGVIFETETEVTGEPGFHPELFGVCLELSLNPTPSVTVLAIKIKSITEKYAMYF